MLMKLIKVDDKDMKDAVKTGNSYIQIGERKFLLMEVEEASDSVEYNVTDLEEEKQLLRSLDDDNPILSEEEINNMLRR